MISLKSIYKSIGKVFKGEESIKKLEGYIGEGYIKDGFISIDGAKELIKVLHEFGDDNSISVLESMIEEYLRFEKLAEEGKIEKVSIISSDVKENQPEVVKGNVEIFDCDLGGMRVAKIDNEPWFCLADVCKILGLTTPARVKEQLEKRWGDSDSPHVDGDDLYSKVVIFHTVKVKDGLGRDQEATFINEQSLYFVIMRSDKPEAIKFQKWVAGEVLPSIRKTGKYDISNLTKLEILEMAIESERERIILKEENKVLIEKIEEDKPKVEMHDRVISTDKLLSIEEFSKLYKNNLDGLGRNKLFKLMREEGILMSGSKNKNRPYEKYMKYFEVKEVPIKKGEYTVVDVTTYVKISEQENLYKLLRSRLDSRVF